MARRPLRTLNLPRRVLIVTLVVPLAIVVSACAPTTPSTAPSSPSPAPTVAAIATAAPTFVSTPGPTANPDCPTIPSLFAEHPYWADAQLDPGILDVDLQVTSIAPIWDPSNKVVPQPRDLRSYPDPGIIVGGREFHAWPSDSGSAAQGPSKLEAATATFTPDGGAATALATRFVPGNENFDQVAVTVPDISGDGLLDIALEWTDQCFRFTASGSSNVTIVPAAVVAGCHLDQDHWAEDARGLFDKGVNVDSTTQRIFPVQFSARYLNEGTGGDPPSWASLWKQHPGELEASSGGWVEVSDAVAGRALTISDVELFTRRDALEAASDPSAAISALWTHQPTPKADGSFRVPVAAEPGRYVLVIRFHFTSACLTGMATSAFSLDVR
jgi:hypothetical protein